MAKEEDSEFLWWESYIQQAGTLNVRMSLIEHTPGMVAFGIDREHSFGIEKRRT